MRVKSELLLGVGIFFAALSLPSVTVAQEISYPDSLRQRPKIYSPYVERTVADADFAEGVYWGDTHLHTSYSTDAGMMGNTLGPEEAFRFARGEEVVASHGYRVRLIRPLDFLVVADHAENLGLAPFIAESNPELLRSEWGRMVHDLVKAGESLAVRGPRPGSPFGIWTHGGRTCPSLPLLPGPPIFTPL